MNTHKQDQEVKENKGIEILKEKMSDYLDKWYRFKTIKQIPSQWVEENVILTREVSRWDGKYSYDLSPYAKEIIDHLHPSNPSRVVSVMKGAQSGITQGVIVPGMAWIIAEHPDNFLFTASDKDIAKKTVVQRFDPLMQSSGLKYLIRPNVVRAKGQRSGDTDFSKEFAGGNAIIEGTNNAGKFRFFSVKTVFMDDFDNAPRSDKKEGSIRKLVEGRQTSYGNIAKTFYVSTPTITQTSNIYEMYLQGDQRKWHWPCPSCDEWISVDWQIKLEGGGYAGIVWELDDDNKLIEESVHFKCPVCEHKIKQTEKYELNLKGRWIPTATPIDKYNVSYYMNSIIIPPGFIGWVDLVKEWLEACPPKGRVNTDLLKVFNNVRLGLPFEEKGEAPKILQLMNNIGEYEVQRIPDNTCYDEGNGEIALITLAADLGGIMNPDQNQEDVRVDYEIVAHTTSGVTYSIDQGSIGTFKKKRKKTKLDEKNESSRTKYTYMHGAPNSVWPILKSIIEADYFGESGEIYMIKLSVIDTGHFTSYANQFINSVKGKSDNIIYGVKGYAKDKYRPIDKDTKIIKKSQESVNLYILQVDQIKDLLSAQMKLRLTEDGSQPPGFMNFPRQEKGKYQMRTFFKHFESEARKEEKKDGVTIGFKWDKKHSDVENHFWDTRIYNIAAREIYIDLIKRSNPSKFRNLDWSLFCENFILK
tara:strand:- start:6829 stop:8925 length:2097 start_codon:yes stop_codon:yes gene_type:complete